MSAYRRRSSLKVLPAGSLIHPVAGRRRSSLRPILSPIPVEEQEVRWDLLDRCLLPLIFCNAAAVLVSYGLRIFDLADVAAFPLFVVFALITTALVLFYHNLKVSFSRLRFFC